MMKIGRISFFVVFLVQGCVTGVDKIPRKMVERELSWSGEFQSCSGLDGGIKLISDNPLVSSLTMDWITDRKQGFRSEVSDPIGQLVLAFQVSRKGMDLSGPMASKLDSLEVNKKGLFEYEGNQIPIRWFELGCLLKGSFPKSWLYHGTQIKYTTKKRGLESEWEGLRTINSYPQASGYCADIEWSVALGLVTKKISYCYDKKKLNAFIEIEDLKVGWRPYDG